MRVDLIVPDNMYFKENKRPKRKKDKETLRQFKQDIFDETIAVETTIKKYFKMTKDLETVYNVAYRNATCEKVSQRVRSELLHNMGSTPSERRWCAGPTSRSGSRFSV